MAGVNVTVGADTQEFEAGMKRAKKQMNQLGGEVREGATQVAKFGAAAVAAGAGALVVLTRQGLKAVDAQAKLARSLGASNDAIQTLQMAAGDTGLDGLEQSLSRMNRRLGAAEFGAGAAAVTVKSLGLNLKELSGMDADQRLESIGRSIQEAGLSSEQAARHLQNLGFEQSNALQFFEDGVTAADSYRSEIDALGLSLSAVDATQVEAANDAMGIFGDALQGVTQQLAIESAPFITAVSKMFQDAAIEAGGFQDTTATVFDSLVDATGFTMDAVEGLRRVFVLAGQGGAVAFAGLVEAVLTVADTIVSGPTRAVNEFIGILNKVPGVDIDQVGMSGLGESIQKEMEFAREVSRQGVQAMHETLMEPMPSGQFDRYVEDTRESAEQAAMVAVEQRRLRAEQEEQIQADSQDRMTDKQREQMAKDLASLKAANDSEIELLGQKHQAELEKLKELKESELEIKGGYAELEKETTERHEAEMTALEKKESDKRKALAQAEADAKRAAMSSAMGDLSTLMSSGSKKLFKIGKAAALAQAVIDGQAAIVGAYKVGASMGGPALGAAYGAAASVATMSRIQQIRSQSFGGGGGGAGGMGAGQTPTAPEPISQQQQARETNVTVRFQGGTAQDQQNGRALLNEINKELKNGGTIRGLKSA